MLRFAIVHSHRLLGRLTAKPGIAMSQPVNNLASMDGADKTTAEKSSPTAQSFEIKQVRVNFRSSVAHVGYIDVGPPAGPVCLVLPGTNSTCLDVSGLAERIVNAGLRFIAAEFPGYGNTRIEDEAIFDESTEMRAELMINFLSAINVQRVVTVAGHSLGFADALHLAANTDLFQSAVSLCGIGSAPHRGIRPFWVTRTFAAFLSNYWTSNIASGLLGYAYSSKGVNTETAGGIVGLKTGILSAAKLDYAKISENAERVRQKRLPILFALTQTDRLIEWELGVKLAQLCGLDKYKQITWLDENEFISAGPYIDDSEVGYPRALVFARGGHFVHRSHLNVVTSAMIHLVQGLKDVELSAFNSPEPADNPLKSNI